jgi:hypothetical protein
MLHVALLTLALASGECPECDRNAWRILTVPPGTYTPGPYVRGLPRAAALVPPPPKIKHPSVLHVIPCPVVRCTGQNCFSATRPFLPGVPAFDYRQDFNYPWSQEPCALRPPAVGPPVDYELIDEPEVVPEGPLLESRRRPKGAGVVARRADSVLVSDQVQAAQANR